MVGRPPAAVLPGFWVERIEPPFAVKVINGVGDVLLETVLCNPVREILWEKMLLVLIIFNKIMRHRRMLHVETVSN
jgi:hypothetical protein